MSVRARMASFELASIPIRALSVGGLETCIVLPSYRVAFDVGLCPPEVVNRDMVLFTHSHMDHMGGVVYHSATRALRNLPPPTYVVARPQIEAFERVFDAWRPLDHSELPHRTIGLVPGEELELSAHAVVRPFRAYHSAPCQGYAVWSRRRKLLPEYRGLDGQQIRRLRVERRVEVTSVVETPEVAFTGDSCIDVIESEAVCRKARVLIMEVTFLDERVTPAEARAKGHIHLDDVVERAHLFQNEALLLTHFSPRYHARDVRRILKERLPKMLAERVTPLVAGLG